MLSILVTGGAGFIGSHTALLLAQRGYHVIVLDKFVHNQYFNPSWATVIKGDCGNETLLHEIFTQYNIHAVMHFAAYIEVSESVKNPIKYYKNNVGKTITLVNTMLSHGVKTIIFSSTAAVYGIPQEIPIKETHPTNPINPYGKTKLIIETILEDMHKAYDLRYVTLRYFNAAGAFPEQDLGEQHKPETHLIPLILQAAQEQKLLTIFGNDYKTKDGTAIRDYIHVRDIAQAHILALKHLEENNPSDIFNLGTTHGVSVKHMIEAVEQACYTKVKYSYTKRRAGDPPILIADASRAGTILGWRPQFSDINFIIKSAQIFNGKLKDKSSPIKINREST